MIINENWPGAPTEMVDGFTQLMGAVGAIPTHKEVTFKPEAREIVTYAAMDYSLQAVREEFSITTEEVNDRLRPAYDQVHGQHGGNHLQKLPHLTYVMLNNRSVPYPDLAQFRPRLAAEEGIVLLGLASRQSGNTMLEAMGILPRQPYKLTRIINDTHEKFGTETPQGLVGRGFMFGFFGPSVGLSVKRQLWNQDALE